MSYKNALEELQQVARLSPLWSFWGWLDVRQRYRRSILGPFWVTMTMAISIFAIGFVYAYIFKRDVQTYLPYVAAGFVLWSFISGYIGESCLALIQNEGFINQMPLPLLTYPVKMLWRYFIMFLHHLVVLAIVLLIFIPFDLYGFVATILGLVLLCMNLFWIGVVLSFISVRLRDLPILISTIFQVMFLITPVIWPVDALGDRMIFVMWNPFYHLLEVVRSPMLYGVNDLWYVHAAACLIMFPVGMVIAMSLLGRWKRKMVFWL
ncbi:MAG TPA: hypothetical protein DEQ60_05215 [Methylophaga sp.]|jgi:ABC-type polysaccharide/polyol phosphate export permease|nr:hypothetical protein [Methylophaga sp.]